MKNRYSIFTAILLAGLGIVMLVMPVQLGAQTNKPLCLTAQGAGVTVSLKKVGTPYSVSLVYSTDEQTSWQSYTFGSVVTLSNVGDRVYFRAKSSNAGFSKSSDSYYQFVVSGDVSASGNIMSLLDASCASTTLSSGKFYHFAYLFKGCTGLVDASEMLLPAKTLANNCYKSMFQQCKNLVSGPSVLPAETLKLSCYENMFDRCSKLVATPELPAKKLAQACYNMMFYNCKHLTDIPAVLPAETLAQSCYYWMFNGCTSLTRTPELVATKLAAKCYESMFEGCTGLTLVSALPATALANRCYYKMFFDCTGLEMAPVLPATTLAENCYTMMFYNCKHLNYLEVAFTDWDETGEATKDWVKNVAESGTFVCLDGLDGTKRGTSYIPVGWNNWTPLCFTAEEENAGITLYKQGSPYPISIEYCVNGNGWKDYPILRYFDGENTIKLSHIGDKVYFRAKDKNEYFNEIQITKRNGTLFEVAYGGNSYHFDMYGKIGASGNIMSLLDKTCRQTSLPEGAFNSLFAYDCRTLTSAPELPATGLSVGCYGYMFAHCVNLTTAPQLPATTMEELCYSGMFDSCIRLTKAPNLPANVLAKYCYSFMFWSCDALMYAPRMDAILLAEYCCEEMFANCTNLLESPELKAFIFEKACYTGMFIGCTQLKKIFVNFPYWYKYCGIYSVLDEGYTKDWVKGVPANPNGEFHCPVSLEEKHGDSYMPIKWRWIGHTEPFKVGARYPKSDSTSMLYTNIKSTHVGQIVPYKEVTSKSRKIIDGGKITIVYEREEENIEMDTDTLIESDHEKIIRENGQVLILKNGVKYNMNGQSVDKQ